MESSEFNDMPKDTMMVIGDMEKFVEFITFNSINKTVKKLMFGLFDKRNYASKLIEKYVIRYNATLKEFTKIECEKYIIKSMKMDEDIGGDDFLQDLGVVGQIKRGDIDRIVIKSSNEILFNILESMTKDKLLKLCWDAENSDFVWIIRKPNEPDKIETKYKPSKKKNTKRQK
jgi:hypothetical protein